MFGKKWVVVSYIYCTFWGIIFSALSDSSISMNYFILFINIIRHRKSVLSRHTKMKTHQNDNNNNNNDNYKENKIWCGRKEGPRRKEKTRIQKLKLLHKLLCNLIWMPIFYSFFSLLLLLLTFALFVLLSLSFAYIVLPSPLVSIVAHLSCAFTLFVLHKFYRLLLKSR